MGPSQVWESGAAAPLYEFLPFGSVSLQELRDMCSMQRWQQQALKRAIRGVDFPGFRFAANLLPHLQAARSGVTERERENIISSGPVARGTHVEPTWSTWAKQLAGQ